VREPSSPALGVVSHRGAVRDGQRGRSDQRYRHRLSAATGPLDHLGVLRAGVPRARRLDVLDLLAPLGRALAVGSARPVEVPTPGQMTPPRGGRS
jgi:hypothetical protein